VPNPEVRDLQPRGARLEHGGYQRRLRKGLRPFEAQRKLNAAPGRFQGECLQLGAVTDRVYFHHHLGSDVSFGSLGRQAECRITAGDAKSCAVLSHVLQKAGAHTHGAPVAIL
jgi:hypothetical protein